ncbi:MAG TPA: YlbF family regulator [Bacilli bacterium]|nr:YlbF family regulator [Bacilli bacterium]HOQ70232.1 YlbF family regulator [Bacilli bacterium]
MNKVEIALNALTTELANDKRVVEFKKVKALIESDAYLKNVEVRLKELQRLMTQNAFNEEKHNEYKREYLRLKNNYETHPYLINYNSLLSEIEDLLYSLKTVIE